MVISVEFSSLSFFFFNASCRLGLTTTILQQLDQLDVQKELDKLERGQAIGDERHKQQLIDFITDQRQLLAECLFCFACQSPLPRSDSLQLLSFLKKCPSTDADGTLDSVTLTLLMAMLYCLNVDALDEAVEMQTSFQGMKYYGFVINSSVSTNVFRINSRTDYPYNNGLHSLVCMYMLQGHEAEHVAVTISFL